MKREEYIILGKCKAIKVDVVVHGLRQEDCSELELSSKRQSYRAT